MNRTHAHGRSPRQTERAVREPPLPGYGMESGPVGTVSEPPVLGRDTEPADEAPRDRLEGLSSFFNLPTPDFQYDHRSNGVRTLPITRSLTLAARLFGPH